MNFVVFGVLSIFEILFFLANQNPVNCSLFGASFTVSSGGIFLLGSGLGCGIAASLLISTINGLKRSQTAAGSWQVQDDKLKVEVQSDKEKQLEAKIATLEAALKQALKKN